MKTTTAKKAITIVWGEHYPLKDTTPGHHPHYVKYPVLCMCNGEMNWVAVDVLKDGHSSVDAPQLVKHSTEAKCQKACDMENKFNGFSKEFVEGVVSKSMGLEKWDVAAPVATKRKRA